MGLLFDDANPDYVEKDAAPVTARPLAFEAWFYPDADPGYNPTMVSIVDKDDTGGGQGRKLMGLGWQPANGVACYDYFGTFRDAVTTTNATLNTWHHACGIIVSGTERRAFIDGGSKGTTTNPTGAVSGLNRVTIGALRRHSPLAYFSGRIARVAIWDLSGWPGATDSDRGDTFETTALPGLSAGLKPSQYPLGLAGYWELWGDGSLEIDLSGNGHSLTRTGTTKTNHAPVSLASKFRKGSYFNVEDTSGFNVALRRRREGY